MIEYIEERFVADTKDDILSLMSFVIYHLFFRSRPWIRVG
jgi:hypothetical protein